MAITIFKHDPAGEAVPGYDVRGFFETSYVGAVLETRERNGYDDSDFYAVVFDEDSGTIKNVDYATTRGWTYLNGATVDATPDVIAKASAYASKLRLEDLKARAAADARKPAVGKTVKVVKGRKVPLGTVGEVFWAGEGRSFRPAPRYKTGAWSMKGALRLGIKTADGAKYFLAATNVEVVDPEDWLPDLSDLEARAAGTDPSYLVARGAAALGMAYL